MKFGGSNECETEKCFSSKDTKLKDFFMKDIKDNDCINIIICRYYDSNKSNGNSYIIEVEESQEKESQEKESQEKESQEKESQEKEPQKFYFEYIIGIIDKDGKNFEENYWFDSEITLKDSYSTGNIVNFTTDSNLKNIGNKGNKGTVELQLNRIDKDEFYVIQITEHDLKYNVFDLFTTSPTLTNGGTEKAYEKSKTKSGFPFSSSLFTEKKVKKVEKV